jgi:ABC-type transporter lipoprotein component MlaA
MPLAGSIAKRVGTAVNDRSLNLELFEEVEDSVLDLYGGTRNLYLQRRERAIRK